jgi:hypothetical protein
MILASLWKRMFSGDHAGCQGLMSQPTFKEKDRDVAVITALEPLRVA